MSDPTLVGCAAANKTVRELAELVKREQFYAGDRAVPLAIERDDRFLRFAADALTACDSVAIASLLKQMSGMSHYFASYARDMHAVDRLTDRLYEQLQGILLTLRSGSK